MASAAHPVQSLDASDYGPKERAFGYNLVPQGEAYVYENPRTGTQQLLTGPYRSLSFPTYHRFKAPGMTVSAKEYLGVTHEDGTVEFREGPCHFFLEPGMVKAEKYKTTVVNDREVLKVEYRDGTEEMIPGPTTFRRDETVEKAQVLQESRLGSDEYVILTHHDGKREIITGPSSYQFDPESTEVRLLEKLRLADYQYGIRRRTDGTRQLVEGPAELMYDLDTVKLTKFDKMRATETQYGLITYADGKQEVREGPVSLMQTPEMDSVEILDKIAVSPTQYAEITRLDGSTTMKAGPASLIRDPDVVSLKVKDGIEINSQEVLIVYRQNEDGTVSRRPVYGPELYIPEGNEWIHQFNCHGSLNDDREGGNLKGPGALRFQKLRLLPTQMYVDVPKVRTADDARLTMRVVVYYELTDLEKMLDGTNDFTADLINAVSSDLTHFVADHDFESFKKEIHTLQGLDRYGTLQKQAERIGYKVTNVVFRGYDAPRQIQEMHEDAIQTHTRLLLETEEEKQRQRLEDFKLEKRQARQEQEQTLAREAQAHNLELTRNREMAEQHLEDEKAKLALEQRLTRERGELGMLQERAAVEFEQLQKERNAEIAFLSQKQEIEVSKYDRLADLGTDPTRVFVAEATVPPEKRIEVVGDTDRLKLELEQ